MRLQRILITSHGPFEDISIGPLSSALNVIVTRQNNHHDDSIQLQSFLRETLSAEKNSSKVSGESQGKVFFTAVNDQFGAEVASQTPVAVDGWGSEQNRPSTRSVKCVDRSTKNQLSSLQVNFLTTHLNFCSVTATINACASILEACPSPKSDNADEIKFSPSCEPTKPLIAKQPSSASTQSFHTRQILAARLAEIDHELAEFTAGTSQIDSLIDRRDHLSNRLSQCPPAYSSMSEHRIGELKSELHRRNERLHEYSEKHEDLKRILANLDLDLCTCRPDREDCGSRHREKMRAEYQDLCQQRERIVHQLEQVNRQRQAVQEETCLLSRKLGTETAQSKRRGQRINLRGDERLAIENEVRRLNQQIQGFERVAWLRERKSEYLTQMDDVSCQTQSNGTLNGRTNYWFKRLTNNQESKINWTQNRSTKTRSAGSRIKTQSVRINENDEIRSPTGLRLLAMLATRIATAERLRNLNRHVPIVVDLTSFQVGLNRHPTNAPRCSEPNSVPENLTRHLKTVLSGLASEGQQILIINNENEPCSATSILLEPHFHLAKTTPANPRNQDLGNLKGNVATPSQPETAFEMDNTDPAANASESEITENSQSRITLDSEVRLIPEVSIDAAERLDSSKIKTANQFLKSDTDKIILALKGCKNDQGLVYDANLIHQMKTLCELMCALPAIGEFDARLLSGIGIQTSAQLQDLPASMLLDRTEQFLLTNSGQRTLTNASNKELIRLLTWLASAHRTNQVPRNAKDAPKFKQAASEELPVSSNIKLRSDKNEVSTANSGEPVTSTIQFDRGRGNPRLKPRKENLNARDLHYDTESGMPGNRQLEEANLMDVALINRFREIGYETVNDFTNASPDTLSEEVGFPKVPSKKIRQWQNQARLACAIPKLRFSDAQLLILAEIDSVESMLTSTPTSIFNKLTKLSKGNRARRFLRGAEPPTLDEVSRWFSLLMRENEKAAA